MKKLIGIIGSGNIGRDPFEKGSWSGSSRFFFTACSKTGILHRAFGVEVPNRIRIPIIIKNYSLDRELWREKFYLDTGYYKALTKTIKEQLLPADFQHNFLQIGAIYNVPEILNGKARCYSYHDGNLAQNVKSPFFNKKIPRRLVARALEYESSVYRGLTKIFTMSEYLRKSFIEDIGIPGNKVVNIGAGINLEAIPPSLPDKNYDRKNILFVGVDFYRKGGQQLLKAFKILRETLQDASLSIIGPRNLYIEEKMAKGVQVLGFLSKSDPTQKALFEKVLQESTLFVMPSLYEPFGIAPLEAMVHSIPCILTNRWAFPEMVTPGETGELAECYEIEDLADKMKRLLSDPDKLRSMGIECRKLVLEKFTWEKVVKRLANEIE